MTQAQEALSIRPMRPDEAGTVAGMVRALAAHIGAADVPRLTAESLSTATAGDTPLIEVTVAASAEGTIAGCCVSLLTFSTWRGCAGMYVCDLFVDPARRGRGLGIAMLKAAAKRAAARGARFIKLEVDLANEDAASFYDRLGFDRNSHDRLFILEPDAFASFTG